MLIVLKSGSLNLLEPSGPVQACIGIALPLPLPKCIQNKDYMDYEYEYYTASGDEYSKSLN